MERILSLYYTHKPGGFCKRLYRLLNSASRKHSVLYLTLDPPPPELEATVKVQKIPFPMAARSGLLFWTLFLLWCPWFVMITARSFRPTRYVVFGAFYSAMLFLTRLCVRAPTTLFLRSLVFKIDQIVAKPVPIRIISNAVDRLGILTASKVICMTESMKEEVRQFVAVAPDKLNILPNDLPSPPAERLDIRELINPEIRPAIEPPWIALTSGVLDRRKNLGALIEGWEVLCRDHTGAMPLLLIAGDGPLRPQLEEQCRRLGLTTVIFLGWVEGLARYLNSVDLIIHPSLHEGVSNSLLEAVASLVPVIASDIPEHRELLQCPELLFNPHDVPSLAARLRELAEPSNRAELIGYAEKSLKACSFDWESRALALITA